MKKYIKSITELNNLALSSKNIQDIERCAESDIFWAHNKQKVLPTRKVKRGEVYQFEFGKNLIPEMSYEHRGLVIGASGKLLYVLPICSYNETILDHQKAYHPIINSQNKKSNFYLLKESEYPFLKHDSVLKLNDIRTVSIARIKYKQPNGFIDPRSDTYKVIEQVVFSKYFYSYFFDYNRLLNEKQLLIDKINLLEKVNDQLQQEITNLKNN